MASETTETHKNLEVALREGVQERRGSLAGRGDMIESDADVLRICEESLLSRHPGGHGTQVRRVYEIAGREPPPLTRGENCFYFMKTPFDALDFALVVREARRRVDERQAVPSHWMAL